MKIAFLSASIVLPGHPARRGDAFEHDFEVDCLAPPLQAAGFALEPVCWDDLTIDWTEFAGVVIGTTWDYWDKYDLFLGTLDKIEASRIPVFNPSALVRWNSRKTYLNDLEAKGIRTIPTLWSENPSARELNTAFDILASDDLVIKRQIGAGAEGQIRLRRGDELSDYPYPAMIQPFMPSIQDEGEYSFIMIDGELSHALIKRAKKGDYRIQSLYGGTEERISPPEADVEAARNVLSVLDEAPLYARVDMIRGGEGDLLLMELELIEPHLYPLQADALGEMFAAALKRRLG